MIPSPQGLWQMSGVAIGRSLGLGLEARERV